MNVGNAQSPLNLLRSYTLLQGVSRGGVVVLVLVTIGLLSQRTAVVGTQRARGAVRVSVSDRVPNRTPFAHSPATASTAHDSTTNQVTPPAAVPTAKTDHSRTVLLIRGHQLTIGAMWRLAQIVRQCARGSPPVPVWVSLDTTAIEGEANKLLSFLRKAEESGSILENTHIHEYNSSQMLTRYPTLREAISRAKIQWRKRSVAFGFHTEAISMWYQQTEVQRLQPTTVWSMEADVGYSGEDITALFRDYENNSAALLTHRCKRTAKTWWHTEVASDAYRKRIPRSNRTWSGEYVQRFSRSLLDAILKMNEEGMHAWSEQAACSMAMAENMTVESFSIRHLGIPFTYRHVKGKSFESKDKWEEVLRHSKKRNKLFHPVKF